MKKLFPDQPHPIGIALAKPIIFLSERKFAQMYANKIGAVRLCLETFREEKSHAEKDGRKSLAQLADAAIYILLIDLDRFVLLSNSIKEQDPMVRHVFEKHLVILIYEFMGKFASTHGNRILRVIKSLPNSENHQSRFKSLSSEIGKLLKTHDKAFKQIRDKIGAHRHPDINVQLAAIESLDSGVIRKIASEIEPWHGKVYACLAGRSASSSRSPAQATGIDLRRRPLGSRISSRE